MPLRSDPLKELLELQERMNRLFEDSLNRERLGEPGLLSGSWAPLADVYETSEAFVIELELPGIPKDDVEIVFEGDELLVRGQRRLEGASRPDAFHRLERRYGHFSRSFQLNHEVDGDGIKADFRDGLLRLEVPKLRSRPGQRVRVERAD